MTSTKSAYLIEIQNDTKETTVAYAYGDLAEVNFIGRKRIPEVAASADNFTVRLVEVEAVGQPDEKREVTSFSGKGKRAAMVLKAELADERKQAADSDVEVDSAVEVDGSAEATQQL
jgi:hypothetical protein